MQRKICFLPLVVLLLAPHARAQVLCFEGAVNYAAGQNPRSVFAADLDRDGDQDLAVANQGSNSISVLKNNGNGTFAPAADYAVGLYPRSVVAADVDGDGDQDLVGANYGYPINIGGISVLKNNGDGTFAARVDYAVGTYPLSVVVTDLDGDGDEDLAVANDNSPGTVWILRNNGDGTFASAVNYAAHSWPRSIFAADLDGDGDQDLAVANQDSHDVSVLKNNGDGTFASAVNFAVGTYPQSVLSVDLDGDGDKDLAVANYGTGVSVLKNNGNGTFATAVNYTAGTQPVSVFAADLDGDGDQDLAAANWSSDNVSVLMNNGDGIFAAAVNYPVGWIPSSIFAADLEGDGDRDLVAANYGSKSISVLINCTTPPPWVQHLNLGPDNPMRVVSHTPAFYWTYVDPIGPQVAFDIEVGTDTLWDIAEMWATGQISSSDTSITYGGLPLVDGSTYFWRVRVSNGTNWSVWRGATFHVNSKPSVPVLNRPVDGAPACLGRVRLFVDNSTDPESDPLAYDFQVFSDSTLTTLIASQSGIRETSSPTGSDVFSTLSGHVEYWWRSRAYDGYEHSEWSLAQWFSVNPKVIRVPVDAPTIAQAVDEACNEDTILIGHGTYLEGINTLGKAIVVAGTLPVESTIVTSAPGTPVVTVAGGAGPNTIIRDLTITGDQGSMGVSITASSSQILNNVINSNVNYGNGGGIWISGGCPVIRGNRIIGNSASGNGGGVFADDGASAVVDSNVFFLNSPDAGAAVAKVGSGGLIVTRNIMYSNSTSGYWGGVIYTERQLSDMTLIQIDHNTIVGNTSASEKGAGIVNYHPEGGEISNNIVAFNKGGYGLYVVSDSGTAPQVSYNDVWWNDSGAYFGVTLDTGNIAADPQLCDTSQQDFHLASTSPCLGTGAGGAHMGALDQGCVTAVPLQPMAPQITVDSPNDRDHVVNHAPSITWRYADPGSRPHEGSEIQVGTDQDWASIEMWRPPILPGPDTSLQYGGLPLTDGATYYMRVRVRNDTLWSTWSEITFRMNTAPSTPDLLSPAPAAIVHTGRPALSVTAVNDAEGDLLDYCFEVYTDSGLTHLVARDSILGITVWNPDSLTAENSRHWWRARTCDGFECSLWSSARSFWVNAYDEPPTSLPLRTPRDGVAVHDPRPMFEWDPPVDPDPGSQYIYTLTVSLNPSFTFKQDITTYLATSFRWPDPLVMNATYWWKVFADNFHGDTITSAARSFRLTTAGDENGDGVADVFDVIMLIDYVFSGGPPPNPASVADVNGDCVADVFDVIYLIDHVFSGGPAPVAGCA